MSNLTPFTEQEVKRGYWLYDGVLRKTIMIFCVNYDYYHEMDNDGYFDMSDETPELNEHGESYIVKWPQQHFEATSHSSYGGLTLEAAIDSAEKVVQQKIEWLT